MSPLRVARALPPGRPLVVGLVVLACAGCNLLRSDWLQGFGASRDDPRSVVHLPAVQPPIETIGMEIVFAERPVDDPLLADRRLWDGVDVVGQIRPEVRRRLLDNGFRVGAASATANPAIETLLGMTSESTGARAPVGERQLAGRRVVRPEGGATEVQTGQSYDVLTLPVDGEPRSLEFRNARCVLRVTAEQLEVGWAKLEFTPEIHHGRLGWRPMATTDGWQGATSQRIHRLYDQRFSIILNTGEMAVITADAQRKNSLGAGFFVDGSGTQRVQRVLFVRLADAAGGAATQRLSAAGR